MYPVNAYDFGDRLLGTIKEKNSAIFDDKIRDPAAGLKVQDLICRFEYEGPCGLVGRIMTVTDGEFGRVVEAFALVDWSPQWEEKAVEFLDGIKLAVSPPSWKPEG